MSKVAVIRCESYAYDSVKDAVKRGLELIGGPLAFVQPGEKILLKPNLLSADPPEKCVTTHPVVFKAVAELLQQNGVNLCYGDSPGFGSPEATARKAGIAAAAAELEIEMADFQNGEEVVFPDGIQNKKFVIARGALDCDGLISLPKLKTHGLTRMTGCVKNQFGCVPGYLKGEYHVKMPDINQFAQMLVDLNKLLRPRFFVMDGIMAMEGNGPRGGRPKPMHVLLFSNDPIALDATVCRIIGLRPETIPTLTAGMKAGLGSYLEQDIEILGDPLTSFYTQTFEYSKGIALNIREIPKSRLLTSLIVPKPYIRKEGCIQCGVCINVCPVSPKVLNWPKEDRTKPPVYDYKRCIRCYCCQELCPESAIEIKVPRLRKQLGKLKREFNT